jgi:hypothetical protein
MTTGESQSRLCGGAARWAVVVPGGHTAVSSATVQRFIWDIQQTNQLSSGSDPCIASNESQSQDANRCKYGIIPASSWLVSGSNKTSLVVLNEHPARSMVRWSSVTTNDTPALCVMLQSGGLSGGHSLVYHHKYHGQAEHSYRDISINEQRPVPLSRHTNDITV